MPEKEKFDLPNQNTAAEIPDLKKKDEERKSGAAWGSAKPVLEIVITERS